jgi:glycosyltransferase involved in cell wall biosynthesis
VHGGDLLAVARASRAGAAAVRRGLDHAALVLANSSGMAETARALGARSTRVVHLGSDLPATASAGRNDTIVTVANLVARKRHADVLRALWLLRDRRPHVRYVVVGDGPERPRLEALAERLGVHAEFRGALPHDQAVAAARDAALFVLTSVDEAFGVAYVEAMAGGVPAIGAHHEPGPEDLARLSEGMQLVAPADPEALARAIDALLADERERRRLGTAARAAVAEHLTWEACGRATVEAYEAALR